MNRAALQVQRTSIRVPLSIKEELERKAEDRAMSLSLFCRCVISLYAEALLYSGEFNRAIAQKAGHTLSHRLEEIKPVQVPAFNGWEFFETSHSENDAQFSFRAAATELDTLNEYGKLIGVTGACVIRSALLGQCV